MITKANCNKFQGKLGYAYERSKKLAEVHPEVFAKFAKRIQKHPHFTSEEEAFQAARDLASKSKSGSIVFAKLGKDEEFYYIDDYFIVTNDGLIIQAADYIGMVDVTSF